MIKLLYGDIMRIGLFDSGVGGLTILKRMLERHPNHHYIYFGDSINLPYGEKSREELISLAESNIDFLLSKDVDMIIIACGTISSNIPDGFKEKYKIPIIDIVSYVSDYINKSDYESVALIATSASIKSGVFEKKIDKKLLSIATKEFVPIIESMNYDEIDKYIDIYLNNLSADALILGCTHYPIIKEKLDNYFNHKIELIDIGYIIANNIKLRNLEEQKVEIYFSSLTNKIVSNTMKILSNIEIKEVR